MNSNQTNRISPCRINEIDLRDETIRRESNGKMALLEDPAQGAFVIANRALQAGEILLEYPSASIALDPAYRQSHCGFCANELHHHSKNGGAFYPCNGCHVVSICRNCRDVGVSDWHRHSGECAILFCLVESFCQVVAEFEDMSISAAAQKIDPIYIITIRLAHRRQLDRIKPNDYNPLPAIDWELFDRLYCCPLPSVEGAATVLTSMATLLQVINTNWHKKHGSTMESFVVNPQECVSIWNKCRSCCHAITDVTRPLGAQSLGMALFIPHSFYNHACAPNAFLSCILPSGHVAEHNRPDNGPSKDCFAKPISGAVWARVVYCCPEQANKGDPVTLSYIPLSGLCRTERQLRLQESYQFACCCKLCEDATVTGSAGFAMEQSVGGDFAASTCIHASEVLSALAPLRELQIECYQNLTLASSLPTKNQQRDDPNDETCSRNDIIEQCLSTIQMAQRGIRTQKIGSSHEVSLECLRLLAVAYSLLEQENNCDEGDEGMSVVDNELEQHRQFFQAAEPALALLDPSALAIQHMLMSRCLRSKLGDKDTPDDKTDKNDDNANANITYVNMRKELIFHATTATEIAQRAVGEDHPFVSFLRQALSDPSLTRSGKKRRLSSI